MSGWLDGTPLASIPGAVAAGLLAGTLLPLLGMWVVLQRVVFLGITLAQVAAAGVALALVLDAPVLPVGLGLTLLVVAAVVRGGGQRVGTLGDSALGALFCAASALALLFVARSPADLDEVQHVLHGNLIYAAPADVTALAVVLAGALLLVGLFFKQVLLATFDPEVSIAVGVGARPWVGLLFATLAVVLSVAMRTTGSLLTFSMLVLPPLAALALGRGLRATFVLAGLIGLAGSLGGLLLAVHADLHLESSLTVTLFCALPVCRAWRRHPAAGLTTLLLVIAGGLALEPVAPPATPEHPHHHAGDVREAETDWHADVWLEARQARPSGSVAVAWRLELVRGARAGDLPESLWIVLTGDGVFHEHELVHDFSVLPDGTTTLTGECIVPADAAVHRLEGQLWTGAPSALDAAPVPSDRGAVVGTDVKR